MANSIYAHTSICSACSKSSPRVRACCGWDGYSFVCDECYVKGKGRTPGHICGIGIQKPTERVTNDSP